MFFYSRLLPFFQTACHFSYLSDTKDRSAYIDALRLNDASMNDLCDLKDNSAWMNAFILMAASRAARLQSAFLTMMYCQVAATA